MKAADFLDGPDDAGAQSAESFLDSSAANSAKPKKPGGIMGDLGDRFKQGVSSTVNYGKINLTDNPQEVASLVAETEKNRLPPTAAQAKMQAEIKPYAEEAERAQGVVDTVSAWGKLAGKRAVQYVQDPREALGMMAENLPNSAPGMAAGIVGAKAGALAGTAVAPGVGTAVGAVAGGILGGTAGGYQVEQGSSMHDQIVKEAQARGVDPKDAAALAPIVEEKYPEFLKASRLKGAGTAGTDAAMNVATFGLAGLGERTIAKEARGLSDLVRKGAISAEDAAKAQIGIEAKLAARNTLGSKLARGAGVTAGEMAGESISEGVGQMLAYGKLDPLDVVDEGLLGLGQGAGMASARGAIYRTLGITEMSAAETASSESASAIKLAQAAFDKSLRETVSIINEPEPLQKRINDMLRVDSANMPEKDRTQYEKDIASAFDEPIGIRQNKEGIEVPYTIGEYLDSQAAVADVVRNRDKWERSVSEAQARLQQLAEEETTQQPDIPAPSRGIMPSIPVVGPLSKVANIAVQSGATAVQQVQQQAGAGILAPAVGGSRSAPVAEPAEANPQITGKGGIPQGIPQKGGIPQGIPQKGGIPQGIPQKGGYPDQPAAIQATPQDSAKLPQMRNSSEPANGAASQVSATPKTATAPVAEASAPAAPIPQPVAPAAQPTNSVANTGEISTPASVASKPAPVSARERPLVPVSARELAQPAENSVDDAYRPLIEALIKNKRNAKQLGFDIEGALQKAKDAMHGKKQMPGAFRSLANKAEKLGDKETASILRQIADMNDARKAPKKASDNQTTEGATNETESTIQGQSDAVQRDFAEGSKGAVEDGATPDRAIRGSDGRSVQGQAPAKAVATNQEKAEPAEDLGAMFDDLMGEIGAGAEVKKAANRNKLAETKKARAENDPAASDKARKERAEVGKQSRKAGDAAKSAAKNTADGFQNAIAGLGKLFGGNGRLSSGLTFDEQTYQQAKPLFAAAVANFKQAGADIKDVMKAVMLSVREQFGDAVLGNMKPYVVRFVEDVRDGKVSYDESVETTDGGENGTDAGKQGDTPLEGVASESVSGTDGSESTGDGSSGSSKGRGAGDSATDGRRGKTGRSGGDSSAAMDSAATGEPGLAPAAIPEGNFEITEEVGLGSGGQMTKYRDNIAAIKVLKTIEAERRRATAPEKKVLARYVGWGGIPNAFRNQVTKQVAKDWDKEVAELESLLTPKELRAAAASTRNAHYTAKEVVDFMWKAVAKMGFAGGMVLEPSVGTGNFVGLMPKEISGDTFVTGIELDSLTARIAGALYPKSSIINTGFQKAALPSGRFKLAIGNPPFGAESLRFQYSPELNGASIHNQFFLGSMNAIEPGGIMAMVVSRYLMDANDATTREKLAIDAELLGAVRLPGSAFKGNALTEVVTDVLFFKKRSQQDAAALRGAFYQRGRPPKMPARPQPSDTKALLDYQTEQDALETALRWTKTAEVKDPLGGEPMVVSQYFADRPGNIVGKMDRSGSMRQGGDIDVKLEKGEKLADRLDAMIGKMNQAPPQSINKEARDKAEQMHLAMGESLRLSATDAEADAIYFDNDGDLSTVVERVGSNAGETALTTIKITPDTPWKPYVFMDMDGNWFQEVAKKDKAGNNVKAAGPDGKPTNRNVYVRETYKKPSDVPSSLRLGDAGFKKIKALIEIRDLLVGQIDLEVSRASSEQMEANRTELRNAYEAFVKKFGYISENAGVVSDMPDEGLLMSLETGYRPEITEAKAKSTGMAAAPSFAKPAAILSRPVAIPPAAIDHADTPSDALAIVLSESGRIDIDRIAELRGISKDAAIAELTEGDKPLAFKDPESGDTLIEKNAYLSGNVRRKLEAARQAGAEANIKALEVVQPEPWSSDKVTARIGGNWIPASIYGEFVSHLLGEPASVTYSKLTNTFVVSGNDDSASATATWGTRRYPATGLAQAVLNSSRIAIYDRIDDKNILNQEETDAANDKAKEIREEFDNWIFKDADRRTDLTKLFNDIFNTRVSPQYDGSHLKFPGKVPDSIVSLRRGQINAIWRGIIDNAVLYDHAVGAGKTFTGIARAIERRRMGLSKKPMIVVPNHMVGEWAAQAYRLYPGAKVLAATKKDLEAKNRRRLFAKIASGDWDMVIVPHSSFQFIAISPETEERILVEELETANKELKDAQEQEEPGSRFKSLSVKEAEALIEKIQKRLDTARGRLGKDSLLTFEQMGVDDLSIDESHEFKNLFYSSRLTDVRGMGNKQGSNKAFDMYSKARVIREIGGSLAFLTGTPISNSAVELYTILRYLSPTTLQEYGMEHFDAFRSQYVDATAKFEPTDSGGSLKLVTRLGRSWSNMRSLMEAYYSVADVVTNDDIKRWYAEDNPGKEFPLPKVKGGDRQAIAVEPTPAQSRILDQTIADFDRLPMIQDIKERNAERLRLMDRARKLSLHAKAVDPHLDDEAGGKLDVVADRAAAIYRKWMDNKGTQLIFLDRGVPKAKGDAKIIKEYDELNAKLREASAAGDEEGASKIIDKLEKYDENEIGELRAAQTSNWSGYQHIKDRLISLGVQANEIAFVQDFDSAAAKEQLFQAVRDGRIRILLGSTPRMGAGTNVQERLVALHHVDATWKPSDIEQREGRIIRQGNLFATPPTPDMPNPMYRPDFEVEILAYVTKRTVDAKLWDLNATKLRMINAIRYYDGAFEMDFDDDAAVGMAEIAAIASGDPLLLERFKLSTEIDNLYRQKRSHRRRVESAEDALRSAQRTIENAPKDAEESKEDAKLSAAFRESVSKSVMSRKMVMAGKEYRHVGLASARMDLENFAGGIGEDEKFSITIDGKEYTSKGGAEEAIQKALGDVEPFVAEVGGNVFFRRSDYARAIRELTGDQINEATAIPPFDAGAIGGVKVRAEVAHRFGGPAMFLGVTGAYESTGRRRSIVGHRYMTPEKHKKGDDIPVTVNGLRPVITDFEKTVGYFRDASAEISAKAEKAKSEIPLLQEQTRQSFKGEQELEQKSARLRDVEAELSGSAAEKKADGQADEGVGSRADRKDAMSSADKAIYGMAAEGKSSAEILKFIASASRNPFYRQLAKLLLKTGIAPKIMVGDGKGWKMNAGEGHKYAAAYNPTTDTVALFRPGSAERNMLHELMHAATIKALGKNGLAAGQMKALFAHVQKVGKAYGLHYDKNTKRGTYGMSDIDEFVAEAFTNPKFQEMLKQVAAPLNGGKKLSTAWQWFVRIVRGILGLPQNDQSALSAALEIGVGVLREDMQIRSGNSADMRYSAVYEIPPQRPRNRSIDRAELTALRGAAARLENPQAGTFFRVTDDGAAIATGQKGTRIPDAFRKFANDNGLTFRAERKLPTPDSKTTVAGGNVTHKSELMPISYRRDGALYFGEMGGEALDRTGRTRFNVAEYFRNMGIEAGASDKAVESIRSDVQFVAGRDEKTGFPTWKGKHVSLSAPRDVTESHDVFYRPTGSERAVKYDIRSANGQIVGHTVLEIDGDWPTQLLDIAIQDQHKGKRYAEKAVAGIVADAGEIGIWHIIPSARSWWERVGTQTVDAHNGTLAFNDYADARASREDAQSLGEDVGIRYNVTDDDGDIGKIVGDSGRQYDDQQRQFFKNVGRDVAPKGLMERTKDYLRNDFWKKMAVGIVDQFRGLRDLNDNGQAYLLARLSKGTAGAFETLLHHGKLSIKDGVYDGDQSGGFIEKLGVPLNGELDDFLWWVAANRAEGLAKHERENLFSPEDIAAGKSLATGETGFDYTIQTGPGKGKTTRSRAVMFSDAQRVFNEFQKNTLDIAEQSGLIDGAARKFWESEFYVPFYRVSEEDGEFIGAKMGKSLVRQQAFKKLKGGTDKLNSDLLSNTLLNWSHLIEASAKNRAAKASLVAAEQVGAAHIAEPGEKKTVWFMDGGKKVEYGVDDPFVMTAITSLEYAGMRNGIMDVMTKFKHWLTIGVTASPAFKVRNLIRDSIQAIGTSGLSYNPIKNVSEGFKQSSRDKQEYVSALASGGLIRFGTMLEGSESSRVRQLIKAGVKDSSILDSEPKWRQFYDKYLEPGISAYNELGNRSEEINRAALYNQLIAQGKTHAEAALMARDLMDFSMQGSFNTIRFLTQVVPFMNARLQGMYKLGRSAKDNPRKLAIVTGAVALASIALMAGYEDDDDWKRREDWDRDNFWWFKFGGIEYRIPKPFEVGAVGTLAERSMEYMLNDEMTGERFRKVVGSLVSNNLSMNPIPQVFKPMLDLYANKDSFTGRPIESMGMQRLDPTMRYNSGTSLVARGLSIATGGLASPVQYDHLARAYFGWLGAFSVGVADMAVRGVSDGPSKPDPDYWKVATQGILREEGTGSSRYVTMIYEQAKELEQAHATYRRLLKDGKAEAAKEYLADHADELIRYRQVERVKRIETQFNERIHSIERSDLDPGEKRIRIERINKMKENAAKRLAPGYGV